MFNNCREIAVSNFHIFHALISTRFRCDLCIWALSIWAYAEHAFCVNASLSTNEDRNQTGCITCNTCLLNHLPVEPTKSVLMRPSMHCISNAFRIFVRFYYSCWFIICEWWERIVLLFSVSTRIYFDVPINRTRATVEWWIDWNMMQCNFEYQWQEKHKKKKWDSRMTHTLRSKMRTDKK